MRVLLVQLPIPPAGPQLPEQNIPLAAAYLKLYARRRGLDAAAEIEILPAALASRLGDRGLVAAILARGPDVVGFTCYLWNIERSLWIARRLKEALPRLKTVFGGPEITDDNRWVLADESVDFAVVGEGEQTFAELLAALAEPRAAERPIAGLWRRGMSSGPAVRTPLEHLDAISSPYLDGILDPTADRTFLLETSRGCVFKCKFCYYPKSYKRQYFLSAEKVRANLAAAAAAGAEEVFLLDPTLNQRRDFAGFLRLLAECNPERRFSYSAELRAEGINPATAKLLRQANFSELEIGLQSIEAAAQAAMDRKVHLAAFERGVKALLDEGIRVKVDLILGLPGDTPDSIRRGYDWLLDTQAYSEVQVFNLSILPGTAFRQEAASLGLRFQPRPPYYVLATPSLDMAAMVELADEAQEAFGVAFDPWPPPALRPPADAAAGTVIDVDGDDRSARLPPADQRNQAFTLWLRGTRFDPPRTAALVRQALDECPHSTLEVVFEPGGAAAAVLPALPAVQAACFATTSYLDRYYSLHPEGLGAAKRLVVIAPRAELDRLGDEGRRLAAEYATLVAR